MAPASYSGREIQVAIGVEVRGLHDTVVAVGAGVVGDRRLEAPVAVAERDVDRTVGALADQVEVTVFVQVRRNVVDDGNKPVATGVALRKVTPSTGNVFRDFGFSKEESEHLLIRADLLIQV